VCVPATRAWHVTVTVADEGEARLDLGATGPETADPLSS
jgi:hypothetical protein